MNVVNVVNVITTFITFIKLITLLLQRFQYLIHLRVTFKHGDEVPVLVVQRQQGCEFDAIERAEEILHIAADVKILVFVEIEFLAEVADLVHRLESGHYDLNIPELVDVFGEHFGLFPAVVAVGAEKHDDYRNSGPEVTVGEPTGTVFLQNTEIGKGGIFQVRSILILRQGQHGGDQ
jgi:hypothetical protein